MSKPKVLIIFPKFQTNDSSHYPYWYQLFSLASKDLDLCIIFESSEDQSNLPGITRTYHQKVVLKPFNLIERLMAIIYYRLRGYTNFYIHYSYWSVFLSYIIKPFLPLKIFYWNCEKYPGKPYDQTLPFALGATDILVTGHHSLVGHYQKLFRFHKPIRIVPNWVSPNTAKPKKLNSKLIHILFVHHLSKRKGSRLLPQIITGSLSHNKSLFFHIVGSGPDQHWLKQKLSKITHVKFYGSISRSQVSSLFKSVDYFIMPSLAEGFPRVILESMIAGIPFVATSVGCVEQIVSTNQRNFIVRPGRSQEFVSALQNLIDYPHKKQLIKLNYHKASEYNLKLATKSFVGLFHAQH